MHKSNDQKELFLFIMKDAPFFFTQEDNKKVDKDS